MFSFSSRLKSGHTILMTSLPLGAIASHSYYESSPQEKDSRTPEWFPRDAVENLGVSHEMQGAVGKE
jgi:hypothetical protein